VLDNNTYNLMLQLVQENQSLWRINNSYIKDSGHCGECEEFWRNLGRQKEEQIRKLEGLVAKHVNKPK